MATQLIEFTLISSDKRPCIDWSGQLLWSATWKQSPTYLIIVSRPKSRTIHSDGALS